MTTPSTPLFQAAYLREQRDFPREDLGHLSRQVDQAYIDIAGKVNQRIIGTFAQNIQTITGEKWYLNGSATPQQTLRQVYSFGSITAGTELDIPTGITNFVQFTRIYGTVTTSVPDWRPLPYVDPGTPSTGIALLVGTVAGQQQIRIAVGATSPNITNGVVILEWLSQF